MKPEPSSSGAGRRPLRALAGAVALIALLAGAWALTGPAAQAAFPGADGKIAFTSDRIGGEGVYLMNADGSGQTRLAAGSRPAWSPDGKRVAFESNGVHVIDADGSGHMQLTSYGGQPAWSPDGARLAFTVGPDSDTPWIYVMAADGSGLRALTSGRNPAWSPDGGRIAFDQADGSGGREIHVIRTDGTGWTRLTGDRGSSFAPSWAPDGARIAFTSTRSANHEIYVMNADGSGQTALTNHPAYDAEPAFSPAGTLIAFTSGRDGDGNHNVHVMSADGGVPTRLTDTRLSGAEYENEPDWQPVEPPPPPAPPPPASPADLPPSAPPPSPPPGSAAALPPPQVTAVTIGKAPARAADSVVLSAQVSGDGPRLEWDLSGDGSPEIVGAAGQDSLRFRPAPGKPYTVKVRAVGPGGPGPLVSRTFPPTAAPKGVVGRRIVTSLGKRRPVYATGSSDLLTSDRAARQLSVCVVPTTVRSGSLELTGCLSPVTSLSQIPSAELGIVSRLASSLPVNRNRSQLELAIDLSDGYVGGGPVSLNGVWLTPTAAARTVIYPQVNAVVSSNASLGILRHRFAHRPDFVLNVDPRKSSNPIGTFPRPSGLQSLARLTAVGDVGLTLGQRTATLEAGLKLPAGFNVAGTGAEARVKLGITAGRLALEGMRLGLPNVDVGALAVKDFRIEYRGGNGDEWRGQGRACVAGSTCLSMVPADGHVRIARGRLAFAGATLDLPPAGVGVPLFKGVNLERIGFGIGLGPTRMSGSARIGVARILKLDGRLVLAFPSARTPFVFARDDVGPGFPAHFYGRAHTRTTVGVSAAASLSVPVVGDVPLASGYLLYEVPGYIAFGGRVGYSFLGVLSLEGAIDGEMDVEEALFNVHGKVRACVVVCGQAIANISRGRGGTGGAGACIQVGGVSIGGGVQWQRISAPFIWPLDGCRWSRFAVVVRAGARAAADSGHVVTIKPHDRSRVIQLEGAGAAPLVRVRGPGGRTVQTAPGSGLTRSQDDSVRIMRFEGAEVGAYLTSVGLQNPRPGTYTIERLDGSTTVTRISEATDPPAASVSATVQGRGARRVLSYRVRPRPAQRVTFLDVSADGSAREIGVAQRAGRGALRFDPAPGPGQRRIEAQFELAGMPAERRVVARFSPPSPHLGRPLRLRVRRTGTRLYANWSKVAGAQRYEIALTTTGRPQRRRTTRFTRTLLSRVPRSDAGWLTVRAVDGLRQGPAAKRPVRRTARRTTRIARLPRCQVRTKLVCRS